MADEIKNSVDVYYGEQLIGNVSHGETGEIDCKGREMSEDIRIKVPYDMKAVKYQDKRFTVNKNGKHTLYSDEDYVMGAAIVEVEVPSDNIWLGEFDSDFPYRVGSIVSQNNMVYICIVKPTDNQPPTDTTYWELLSGKIQDEKIVDIITHGKLEFEPDEGYVAVRKFTANVAETPTFDGTINIEPSLTTISGCYIIDASKAYNALSALPASKTYTVDFSAGSFINGDQEKKGFISMTFNTDGDKSIIYGRADSSITAFSSTEHMTGGNGFAPYYNAYEEGNGAMVNFYEGTVCRRDFKELFLSIADVNGLAPTLISFNIDGTSYQAEAGMTWREWCESDYNTAGYETSSTTGVYASDGSGAVYNASGSPVNGSNTIVANHAYIHGNAGGAD